jgi:FHA domain
MQAVELRLGVNRVGRDPECELCLDHSTVSSLHCELSLSADGVYLHDCGSTNGTFLNGEPVAESWLMAGQELRFGDVELYVESTDARIAIPEIEAKNSVDEPQAIEQNGELFCVRHPERRITFKCTKCTEVMCNACVGIVKRQGGRALYLCRVCHNPAERIMIEQPKQKKGFLGYLQDTVRLKFGGRPK